MGYSLITGGSGLLGRSLKKILPGEFKLLDLMNNEDITIRDNLIKYKPQTVIHLAANVRNDSYSELEKLDVLGTKNVLELCRENNAKMIFASSAGVYGKVKSPIKEDFPLNPLSANGKSKLESECLCKEYHHKYGIDVTILRIFNMYGPGQRAGFLIPDILSQLHKEKIILRSKKDKRDYVYVDDVAEALVKSIKLSGLNIINIGHGKSYSPGEIAKIITDKPIEYSSEGEFTDIYADISLAKNKLKWFSKTPITTGIEKIKESYSNEK